MQRMKKSINTAIAFLFFALSSFAQAGKHEERVTLPLDSFTAKIGRQAQPQIIDARSPEEFSLNHISNALNFNVQTNGYATLVQALDKSRPVFIYAISTGRSSVLAHDLKSRGFAEAYDLEGGSANWIGSGQPYYTSLKKGLSPAEFQQIIATNKKVLVNIGSRYCGLCKKAKPIVDSIRNEHPGDVTIVEIELEESPQLIAALKTVNVFPYFILYDRGAVAFKRSGVEALKYELEEALAKAK